MPLTLWRHLPSRAEMQPFCTEIGLQTSSFAASVWTSHTFAGIETENERTSVEDFPPLVCKIRTIKEYMMARSCSINYPLTEACVAGMPGVRLRVGFKTSISVWLTVSERKIIQATQEEHKYYVSLGIIINCMLQIFLSCQPSH